MCRHIELSGPTLTPPVILTAQLVIISAIFGYMKYRIWQEDIRRGLRRPQTLDELWERILACWDSIPPQMLRNIRQSYRQNRIDLLIRANGERFESES